MPWSCAVLNCKSVYKKDGGIQFFGFPFKNEQILKKWTVAVGKKKFEPTKNNKVCGLHFDQKDYVVRPGASFNKLREYAVPWKRLPFKSVRNSPIEVIENGSEGNPNTVVVGRRLSPTNITNDHDYIKEDNEDIHLNLKEMDGQLKVGDISGIILVLSDKRILSARFEDDTKLSKDENTKQIDSVKEFSVNNINEEKIDCPNCNKRFKFEERLRKHMLKTHHYNYCRYCKKLFQTIIELKNHTKEMHKDVDYLSTKPYFCDKCMEKFTSKHALLKHLRTFHGAIQCSTCGRSYFSKDELDRHRKGHPNNYVCEVCGAGFKEKLSLKLHLEVHNDPNTFVCSVCGRGFKTRTTFRQHLLSHLPAKNFLCEICSKLFRTKRMLMLHQRYTHSKNKAFECAVCYKRFSVRTTLRNHIRLKHFRVKAFQCDICDKAFGRKDYLTNHKRVHDTGRNLKRTKFSFLTNTDAYENRRLSCNVCGKTVKNMSCLRHHLNVHARIRKFKCSFCGLMFLQRTSKIRHEKSHRADPENKYICPVCWQRSKTKGELDEHMAGHNSKLKRHACDSCGETFSRKHLLENHVQLEHTKEDDIIKMEKEIIEEGLRDAVRQDFLQQTLYEAVKHDIILVENNK